MGDIKNKTSTALVNYYKKTKDFDRLIKVAELMLSENGTNPQIRGEICEVILSLVLYEYIIKHNLLKKGWFYKKGLILNDRNNPTSSYLTEIDLVLFTPRMIYVFECKSYKGKKVLKDKGSLYTIDKNNKEKFKLDVYEQNRKHSLALLKYILPYYTNTGNKQGLIKMVMFNFSKGYFKDLRDDKSR